MEELAKNFVGNVIMPVLQANAIINRLINAMHVIQVSLDKLILEVGHFGVIV